MIEYAYLSETGKTIVTIVTQPTCYDLDFYRVLDGELLYITSTELNRLLAGHLLDEAIMYHLDQVDAISDPDPADCEVTFSANFYNDILRPLPKSRPSVRQMILDAAARMRRTTNQARATR